MHPIIDGAAAAALPEQLRKLAYKIDRSSRVARIDAPRAVTEVREAVAVVLPWRLDGPGAPEDDPALSGYRPPTPRARGPPPFATPLPDGALWVRPRRAAKIKGCGLTKIHEFIKLNRVLSKRIDGMRLIYVPSLLALGEEQAPQFPAGLAAARARRELKEG
jgi:hypothetical protein